MVDGIRSSRNARQYEGRATRLSNLPVALGGTEGHDVAVFDKSRASSPDGGLRLGLGRPAQGKADGFIFRRTDSDRRPSTPVPFHEPDPDRFAKSEALRLQIEETDRRRAERFGSYEEETPVIRRNNRYSVPDVENPDTTNCCAVDAARVKGQRGDRILYWRSAREADAAFDAPPTARRIENAMSSGSRLVDPYGWRWTRVGDARADNGKARRK